jgi:hypothetical protein
MPSPLHSAHRSSVLALGLNNNSPKLPSTRQLLITFPSSPVIFHHILLWALALTQLSVFTPVVPSPLLNMIPYNFLANLLLPSPSTTLQSSTYVSNQSHQQVQYQQSYFSNALSTQGRACSSFQPILDAEEVRRRKDQSQWIH